MVGVADVSVFLEDVEFVISDFRPVVSGAEVDAHSAVKNVLGFESVGDGFAVSCAIDDVLVFVVQSGGIIDFSGVHIDVEAMDEGESVVDAEAWIDVEVGDSSFVELAPAVSATDVKCEGFAVVGRDEAVKISVRFGHKKSSFFARRKPVLPFYGSGFKVNACGCEVFEGDTKLSTDLKITVFEGFVKHGMLKIEAAKKVVEDAKRLKFIVSESDGIAKFVVVEQKT